MMTTDPITWTANERKALIGPHLHCVFARSDHCERVVGFHQKECCHLTINDSLQQKKMDIHRTEMMAQTMDAFEGFVFFRHMANEAANLPRRRAL